MGDRITALQQLVSPFGKVCMIISISWDFFSSSFWWLILVVKVLFYIIITNFWPFQTDTASVLSEAIEYIKFLHEQVNVSSFDYNIIQLVQDSCENIIDINLWILIISLGSKYPVHEKWSSCHATTTGVYILINL